jgi:hypothetical protein
MKKLGFGLIASTILILVGSIVIEHSTNIITKDNHKKHIDEYELNNIISNLDNCNRLLNFSIPTYFTDKIGDEFNLTFDRLRSEKDTNVYVYYNDNRYSFTDLKHKYINSNIKVSLSVGNINILFMACRGLVGKLMDKNEYKPFKNNLF